MIEPFSPDSVPWPASIREPERLWAVAESLTDRLLGDDPTLAGQSITLTIDELGGEGEGLVMIDLPADLSVGRDALRAWFVGRLEAAVAGWRLRS